jgi:HSP20 family molecular chaperone IbpA
LTRNKNNFGTAAQEIEQGLGSLFSALSDAIEDVASKLDDGNSGAVARDITLSTDKGPMRLSAAARFRVGGLPQGGSRTSPEPVNKKRATSGSDQPSPRTHMLSYDVFEDDNGWVLTADIPGVSAQELTFKPADKSLQIETSGKRLYVGKVDLNESFDFERIQSRLHNGVLTVHIPKGEVT